MSEMRDLILRALDAAPAGMPHPDLATVIESVLILKGFAPPTAPEVE